MRVVNSNDAEQRDIGHVRRAGVNDSLVAFKLLSSDLHIREVIALEPSSRYKAMSVQGFSVKVVVEYSEHEIAQLQQLCALC